MANVSFLSGGSITRLFLKLSNFAYAQIIKPN